MLMRRPFLMFLAGACLVLGSSAVAYRLAFQSAQGDLQALGRHRLDLYAASLEREIAKYAFLPGTLNLAGNVVALVSAPGTGTGSGTAARRSGEVNAYLQQLNARAGTLSIYVMDSAGLVRAASNWNKPDSFVGENLAFRPYFVEALANNEGRFFGIGTTRGEPGYYLASAIFDGVRKVGVAAVKVSLEQLEKSWATVEAPVMVSDEYSVVILSTVPDWKFATLRQLDAQAQAKFERTQQFNHRALHQLGMQELHRYDSETVLVNMAPDYHKDAASYSPSGHFLSQSRKLPGTDWTFTILSRLDTVERLAANEATIVGFAVASLLLLALIINERRRRVNERLAAREALQRAHDELERKVDERTADLTGTNLRLQAEVTERARVERTLREAQDELVQTGKLAVIGQLSTGIAHELNQPLAALRTLSANAVRFLDRGDIATVQGNLVRIGDLVDRMGTITGQLRNFARKSKGNLNAVSLTAAIQNACSLLANQLQQANVEVRLRTEQGAEQGPELVPALVWCDGNRLEQVLVNLLGNAADAVQGQEVRRVDIWWDVGADRVSLHLRDTGPGLSDEALQRMFEPFFTTKSVDRGLGLGLVISAGIVRDFGGTLQGVNHPQCGAEFILELPLYKDHG